MTWTLGGPNLHPPRHPTQPPGLTPFIHFIIMSNSVLYYIALLLLISCTTVHLYHLAGTHFLKLSTYFSCLLRLPKCHHPSSSTLIMLVIMRKYIFNSDTLLDGSLTSVTLLIKVIITANRLSHQKSLFPQFHHIQLEEQFQHKMRYSR